MVRNDTETYNQLDTGEHSYTMKFKILLMVVLTLALVLVSAIHAAPRLVLPETTFNFGYVPQNSKLSHVFWLYSKGDDSLQILKVIPG